MTNPPIVVVGAGGHAVVIVDALTCAGHVVECFVDTDPAKLGMALAGLRVLSEDELAAVATPSSHRLANGIGGVRDTALRHRVQDRLEAAGWTFVSVRHPAAIVSPTAALADGTQVLAGAIVQPGARIGPGTIVNTGAVVEHDCRIGGFVHVAPRATVCGNVAIGDGSLIGAGSIIIQGINIGPATLIGAGATVVRDFEGNGALRGVPAKPVGMDR